MKGYVMLLCFTYTRIRTYAKITYVIKYARTIQKIKYVAYVRIELWFFLLGRQSSKKAYSSIRCLKSDQGEI